MAAESREVQAIRQYLIDSGVPHKVTATLGRWISQAQPCYPHTPGSYHCRIGTDGPGRAVDVAGPVPSTNSPELRAILAAFAPVRGQLAELLGPGDPGHSDHVHVAVPLGTFIRWPQQEEPPMEGPPRLIAAFPLVDDEGNHGYALVAEDGAVYVFGCNGYAGGLKAEGDHWTLR